MSEAVGRGDDLGQAMLVSDAAGDFRSEIGLDRRYPARLGDLADIGRLDAENAMPRGVKIRQQCAVVGADVDDEIVLPESDQRSRLAVEPSKVLAQNPGRAAGIGVARREQDFGIEAEAELNEFATA